MSGETGELKIDPRTKIWMRDTATTITIEEAASAFKSVFDHINRNISFEEIGKIVKEDGLEIAQRDESRDCLALYILKEYGLDALGQVYGTAIMNHNKKLIKKLEG